MRGKTIVVGVSGGIAAYKACEAVRLLVQAGATVQVVLTRAAEEFVTPLTLQALSGRPVARRTFDLTEESEIGHIRIADTADALLIAPATANVIAKLATGIADDLLTTVVLATRAPVLVAPAMNVHMWENATVQANVARLRDAGHVVIEPASGALACGYEGAGRLPEPDVLVEEVAVAVTEKTLAGRRVLVTAGPTWEALDPVRHVANRSSGKMGFAVARAARRRGARVTLVTGPTALADLRGVECVHVTSAREMEKAALHHAAAADCVVMAAAVGDYRPLEAARHKIKRGRGDLEIRLTPNPDILAKIGALPGQRVIVGFAAETRDLVANARRKLQAKGVHLMVANDVTAPDAGFDVDTNIVTLIDRSGRVERFEKMSKDEVAGVILDRVRDLRTPRTTVRAAPRRLRRR
ncbi:MAG: bifunctional phosphopantothenoylcysteine decarboxylase/phosphopantothenate--cysteine ligase CoaBC [Deltaproteobacteria bacterium]|nr:MAG: bifunctional phosphopantothenoylcysteine decarboxylase/phosphopantothenate--cysteine ligase CoaBC [Deltaproteobacteria bacterium]